MVKAEQLEHSGVEIVDDARRLRLDVVAEIVAVA